MERQSFWSRRAFIKAPVIGGVLCALSRGISGCKTSAVSAFL